MSLQRISVSVPVADPSLDPESVVPVFHDWIRRGAVEGLLIDVARYGHVPDGPGIVLLGHEGDYSLDLAGGRPSLRYTLKRDNDGSPRELLDRAFGRLDGAIRVAADAGIDVDRGEVVVRVYDRLRAPNTAEAVSALTPDAAAAAAAFAGAEALDVTTLSDDPREPVALLVRVGARDGARPEAVPAG
jgi:hypothetical protein